MSRLRTRLTDIRARFRVPGAASSSSWAEHEAVADVGNDWVESSYYDEAEFHMDSQWNEIVWPSIFDADFDAVVDLAAGHGRNSVRLAPLCRRLYIIDIHETNIDFCRDRLADVEHARFLLNDGLSLPLADQSVSLVYCFDSMVHFDSDVVRRYLAETYRVLRPGGRGFFHHSNYSANPAGDFHDNPGWRNFMSAELFEHYAAKAGLSKVRRRVLDWDGPDADCVTVVERGR